MPGRVWTREKLIKTIRDLNEQGVDLSPTSMQKTHSALFSSARSRSHFGTWRDAVQAAGLTYDEVKRVKQRWSREAILNQIRQHAATGDDLLDPHFKLKHRSLYLAACAHRYFGSWRRAIEAAGLDHATMRESRVWTRMRIMRTIQDLARDGKPLGWAYIEENCPGIYRAARRKENFGSWHNAVNTAIQEVGMPPLPSRPRHCVVSVDVAPDLAPVRPQTDTMSDPELDAIDRAAPPPLPRLPSSLRMKPHIAPADLPARSSAARSRSAK